MNNLSVRLFLVLLLLLTVGSAEADTYCVNATTLNIRSKASKSAAIVGRLHAGDTVEVLKLSEDKQWGNITQPENGWISMQYLDLVENESPDDESVYMKELDDAAGWIVQSIVFKIIRILLLILVGFEIVAFVFVIRNVMDVSFSKIKLGAMAFAALFLMTIEPNSIVSLPLCLAAIAYYPLLYWGYEGILKKLLLLMLISGLVVLAFLFIVIGGNLTFLMAVDYIIYMIVISFVPFFGAYIGIMDIIQWISERRNRN